MCLRYSAVFRLQVTVLVHPHVEIDFDDRWSTFAEVRLVNDLEFDTPVDRGGIQAQDELELTIIRTGLKYRF